MSPVRPARACAYAWSSARFLGRGGEGALQRLWFLVSISQPDSIADSDSIRVSRTMLMFNMADVEELTQVEVGKQLQLESVSILAHNHKPE